ncbi:hypothetical protein FRC03_007891, partial [Tulasnella sp. 419]
HSARSQAYPTQYNTAHGQDYTADYTYGGVAHQSTSPSLPNPHQQQYSGAYNNYPSEQSTYDPYAAYYSQRSDLHHLVQSLSHPNVNLPQGLINYIVIIQLCRPINLKYPT